MSNLNAIVFSYLNILQSVWYARDQGLLPRKYAASMIDDHFAILKRNEEIVWPLLETRATAKSLLGRSIQTGSRHSNSN